MFRVISHNGPKVIMVGTSGFHLPYTDHFVEGSWAFDAYGRLASRLDPIGHLLSDHAEWYAGEFSATYLTQQEPYAEQPTSYRMVAGLRPDTYTYRGHEDTRYYGNPYSQALELLRDGNFSSLYELPPCNEKNTIHVHPYGTIMEGAVSDRWADLRTGTVTLSDNVTGSEVFNCELITDTGSEIFYVSNDPDYLELKQREGMPTEHRAIVGSFIKSLQGYVNAGNLDFEENRGTHPWKREYSELSFKYLPHSSTVVTSVEYSYHLEYYVGDNQYIEDWEVTFELRVEDQNPEVSPVTSESPVERNITDSLDVSLHHKADLVRWQVKYPDGQTVILNDEYVWGLIHCTSHATPLQGVNPSGGDVSNLLASESPIYQGRPSTNKRLYRLYDAITADMPNIRPSSFYSTADAIDTAYRVLETNHLETLSELRDIGQMVAPFQAAFRTYTQARRGSFFGTLKALLDFLTDVKLLYSFGIKPAQGSIEELAGAAGRLSSKIGSLSHDQTYYGKFTYELPEDVYGYEDCILVTRSKVRIANSDSALLMSMLSLKAVGLLPTLSTMWDLVPFSFVIDWFTNLGDRFAAIDSQALILALDIKYAVHSYAVYCKLSQSDLDSYGLSPMTSLSSEEYPCLKYYKREVSIRAPSIRYSKYDFTPAGGVPDWGTFGSLLYKLR